MAVFKIRDLMVALRPGLPTPERPKPLDCPDISCVDPSGVCDAGFGDSIGCGVSQICGVCSNFCSDCTDGCTDTCQPCTFEVTNPCGACTNLTCGPTCICSNNCTLTCGPCTAVCTQACTGTCHYGSCAGCSIAITCARSCPAGGTFVLPEQFVAQMAPGELQRLKTQLRATMQQVSQREKVLAAAAEKGAIVPQTVEQVDALEKKLSEALEELRQRRAELQKAAEAKAKQSDKKEDKGKAGRKDKK